MKPYRIWPLLLGLILLTAGCSSHFYRTGEKGVSLYLRAEKTTSVVLYTSTDEFYPNMAERKGRTWVNHVPTHLEFSYFYKVDGKLFTPDCRYKEKDDFGFENCIYAPGL